MSDGTTHADLMGVGNTLEFEGKTYELKKPDQIQQAQFQRWLEDRALAAILRDTESPPEMVREDRRQFVQDRAAGVYEYGGEVAVKALNTWTGAARLLEIVLGMDDATARRVLEQEAQKVNDLIGKALDSDPKAVGRLLRRMGLPADWLDARPNDSSSSSSSTRRTAGRSRKSRDSPTTSSTASGPPSPGTSTASPDPPPPASAPSATGTSSSDGSNC